METLKLPVLGKVRHQGKREVPMSIFKDTYAVGYSEVIDSGAFGEAFFSVSVPKHALR